jgi:hypothetical protein
MIRKQEDGEWFEGVCFERDSGEFPGWGIERE